jgi:DNA modification methylase
MSNHEIIQGDALVLVKGVGDESKDAVITDPPYGADYQSGHRPRDERFEKIANDGQPFVWWLYDAYRVLKEGGHLVCFCDWKTQEAFRQAIVWAGFTVKSHIVWDKGNHGSGDLNGSFAPQHELAWHATKGKGTLYGPRPVSVIPAMRISGPNLVHPNQKPIPLLRYLVRATTPHNGKVLDLFAGSGSTGEACRIESRDFLGFELDPKYAALARKSGELIKPTMDFEEMFNEKE